MYKAMKLNIHGLRIKLNVLNPNFVRRFVTVSQCFKTLWAVYIALKYLKLLVCEIVSLKYFSNHVKVLL